MSYKYLYVFDKKNKFDCPYCEGKKTWRKYINVETGEYCPEEYGICDRSESCGAHYKPPYNKNISQNIKENKSVSNTQKIKTYIPHEVCKNSIKDFMNSCFAKGLINTNFFSPGIIEKTLTAYAIGNFKGFGDYKNATTIPYVDEKGNIHAIQCKTFDKDLHTNESSWVHSLYAYNKEIGFKKYPWLKDYLENETKQSCLFGAHLLAKYPNNPINLVESPKTAIICTLVYGLPKGKNDHDTSIWLATGSKGNLTLNRLECLKGKRVRVFADLSENNQTYRDWKKRMSNISNKLNIKYEFDNSIYDISTPEEQKKGLDLADFLLKELREEQKNNDLQFQEKKNDHIKHDEDEKPPKFEYKNIEGKTCPLIIISSDKEYFKVPLIDRVKFPLNFNSKLLKKRSTVYHTKRYESVLECRNIVIKDKEYKILELVEKEIEEPYSINNTIVSELETYFNNYQLPISLKMDNGTSVKDLKSMISSHLKYIKSNIDNDTYKPYLNRLEAIKDTLSNN